MNSPAGPQATVEISCRRVQDQVENGFFFGQEPAQNPRLHRALHRPADTEPQAKEVRSSQGVADRLQAIMASHAAAPAPGIDTERKLQFIVDNQKTVTLNLVEVCGGGQGFSAEIHEGFRHENPTSTGTAAVLPDPTVEFFPPVNRFGLRKMPGKHPSEIMTGPAVFGSGISEKGDKGYHNGFSVPPIRCKLKSVRNSCGAVEDIAALEGYDSVEGVPMNVPPGYRILEVLPRGEGKLVEALCETAGGGVEAGMPVRLYPGGRSLRIRGDRPKGENTILRLKGISRSFLRAGALILPAAWYIEEEKEGLFFHDGGAVPDGPERIRGGLHPEFNAESPAGRVRFRRDGSFLRAAFPDSYPMVPGMCCSILNSDGSKRRLTLLCPGPVSGEELRRLNATASRRPHPHPPLKEVYQRLLFLRGYVNLRPGPEDVEWTQASSAGDWLVRDSLRHELEKKIIRLSSRPGGADEKILRLEGFPAGLLQTLAEALAAEGALIRRNSWYFPPGSPRLAPFHRSWLSRVEESDQEGLRKSAVRSGADTEALDILSRSGLIIGGRDMWFAPKPAEALIRRLLDGLKPGDPLTMGEARDRLGGSRVRTLEILGILDDRGVFDLSGGEERRILR